MKMLLLMLITEKEEDIFVLTPPSTYLRVTQELQNWKQRHAGELADIQAPLLSRSVHL